MHTYVQNVEELIYKEKIIDCTSRMAYNEVSCGQGTYLQHRDLLSWDSNPLGTHD